MKGSSGGRSILVGISCESSAKCQETDGIKSAPLSTGAARGLGEGIVRRLAQDGWSILMSDINPSVHETAAKIIDDKAIARGRLIAAEHNVANAARTAELIELAVERFGGMDLAVANAGTGGVEIDLIDLPVEEFENIADVNYRGVFLNCKYAGARHAGTREREYHHRELHIWSRIVSARRDLFRQQSRGDQP